MPRRLLNDDLHSDSDRRRYAGHGVRQIFSRNPDVTIHRRVAAAAFFAVLCLAASMSTAARADGTAVLDASFRVQNTNTSGVPCPSDNAGYTVHGHLVGPQSVLAGPAPRAVTVYLGGEDAGEWNWRLTAIPGYDWPADMAELGHVSLTIDMLGYGASGHPDGEQSCWGSQADVAHQIITQLRKGTYAVSRGVPVRFQKIVLAGHDAGGAIAEIEAYSYKDTDGHIDGLALVTYADQGFTPLLMERFARAGTVCASGGEPAYPGGPGGYYYMERPDEYEPDLFYDAEPAVIDAVIRLRERNPCGGIQWATPAVTINPVRDAEIKPPVLLVIGREDKMWTQEGWALQKGHFSGSSDVTAVSIRRTGHYPMFERTLPQFRKIFANWLTEHDLGG
jgi:pimeloyl-ACP methyl ester carboxylesterase